MTFYQILCKLWSPTCLAGFALHYAYQGKFIDAAAMAVVAATGFYAFRKY